MFADYKGYSIHVDRVSYGANGNPGKIEWSINFKGKDTVFDDVIGYKTVKEVVGELKTVIDDGMIGCDYEDIADNAFEFAAGVVPENVNCIDKPVLIWCAIILTVCLCVFGSRLF